MMIEPGAEALTLPLPNSQQAKSTPRPGPGLASTRYMMDFPNSLTCSAPIGPIIPWLMALFKNSTFAGSTKSEIAGSTWMLLINVAPAVRNAVMACTIGPITR